MYCYAYFCLQWHYRRSKGMICGFLEGGPNSIPGQRWSWNQSTWIWPRAGSIWPHYMSRLQKADQIPGHLWAGTEYDPQWTLYRVTLTRMLLEWRRHTSANTWTHLFHIFFLYKKNKDRLILSIIYCHN